MPIARSLCLLIAIVTVATASEPRIDLGADREALADVVVTVSEVLEIEVVLGQDLLDLGAGTWPIDCYLVRADATSTLQALAHSIGCWWAIDGLGRRVLTRERRLPSVGPSRVRTYTSNLAGRHALARDLIALMDPWLGDERGIAYHAAAGNWIATLDRAGHRELEDLLTVIERGEPLIPPLLPEPPLATRPDPRRADALALSDPHRLPAVVRDLVGRSAAIHDPEDIRLRDPLRLISDDAAGMLQQFRDQGVPAALIEGVLCIAARESPHPRRHPALRMRTALIPIGHLGRDEQVAAAIAGWTDPTRDTWYARPGAGIIHLPERGMLLARVDDAALRRLLDHIEAAERAFP